MTGQDTRRDEILDAGLALLAEHGWQATSMIAIAKRARASKETLYNWFGDKEGFFASLIRRNAGALDQTLPERLEDMDLTKGLTSFGSALLELLLGDASIAINRAAIADAGAKAPLGQLLIAEGRGKSLPRLARWLDLHMQSGTLARQDAKEAAISFVTLLKGEYQLERLLGARTAPTTDWCQKRAHWATQHFLKLYAPVSSV